MANISKVKRARVRTTQASTIEFIAFSFLVSLSALISDVFIFAMVLKSTPFIPSSVYIKHLVASLYNLSRFSDSYITRWGEYGNDFFAFFFTCLGDRVLSKPGPDCLTSLC